MSISETAGRLSSSGRRAADSRLLRVLARVGLAAQGLVFLLVAIIAAQVATGGSSSAPDQSGALADVARQPFGHALLWVVALGLFAFVLWQLTDVIWGVPGQSDEDRKKAALARGKAACVAIGYASLGVTTVKVAVGSGSAGTSASSEQSGAAGLLGLPGGQLIVGVIGVVVLGVGIYSVVKGVRAAFTARMDLARLEDRLRSAVVVLGRIGYIARGVVYGIVGVLVVVAAVRYQPKRAGGLDSALHALAKQPYGGVLLGVVAVGLACFGIFCFVDARFRRL